MKRRKRQTKKYYVLEMEVERRGEKERRRVKLRSEEIGKKDESL